MINSLNKELIKFHFSFSCSAIVADETIMSMQMHRTITQDIHVYTGRIKSPFTLNRHFAGGRG